MSVTNIENFTVTQADYPGVVGNSLYGATGGTGTVELVLTPNQGYALTAADFSWNGTPSNGVTAVNFVQSGTNVKCNLTIDPGYAIPAGGISFPVCVSGKSVLIPINLALNFSNTLTNAVTNVSDGTLAFSDDRGDTSNVLDVTLTADQNNRFPSPLSDSAFFTITNTNPNSSVNDSAFTVTKTYGQLNGHFNSMRVIASYTYPTTDETFNFNVSGLAEAIPVAVPKIINGFDSGKFSSVNWKGTSRRFTMYGTAGATFDYSLDSGSTNYGSGSVVVATEGYGAIPLLTFPERAATTSRDFTLTITATTVGGVQTTLNPTAFGGSTTTHGFTIIQEAQDTVFITRNVTVVNSNSAGGSYFGIQGWVADGLGFAYIENETFIKRDYPMSDTLSSQGITTTITDVFEVPINADLTARINYTQHSTPAPGLYYLRSVVTGMTSGDGTTDVQVANSTGALGQLSSSVEAPGAGVATAGVINLLAQDTSF